MQAEIARRAQAHQPKAPPEPSYPFTGLIRCGRCGRPYKRKHANAGGKYEKIVWICPTFNEMGKEECDSQQIPSDNLEAKAAEALGLPFSETALRTYISEIRVPAHNTLIFMFVDGHEAEVPWEHPSRRASWTPEMREAARQKALRQHRKEHENV